MESKIYSNTAYTYTNENTLDTLQQSQHIANSLLACTVKLVSQGHLQSVPTVKLSRLVYMCPVSTTKGFTISPYGVTDIVIAHNISMHFIYKKIHK